MDMDNVEREVIEKMRKMGPYPRFYDWPVKETKELAIVRALIEAGAIGPFVEVRPGRPDPPDAIGVQEDGTLVGIEVTELVSRKALEHNVRALEGTAGQDPLERMAKTVYWDWDRPDLVAAVEERLRAKDAVTLKGGPYGAYVVALHTDEKALNHTETEGWLRDHTFTGMGQVTAAYLLFSPDGNGDPYIRLNVAA